jgi:tetratricopeptide (TPR) repeat protein
MPTSPQRPVRPGGPGPQRGAIERLYVYWLVSALLLVLALVVVVLVTQGIAQRQRETIDELTTRIASLEQRPAEAPATSAQTPAREPPDDLDEDEARPEPATNRPMPGAARTVPSPTPPRAAETPVPPDREITAKLGDAVGDDPVTPSDVEDVDAAAAVVETGLRYVSRASWSATTWARLAVLSRLLGRDVPAEAFADRARAGKAPLANYAEVTARSLLARGRAADALALVQPLVDQEPGAVVRVLTAVALLRNDDPASADEMIDTLALPVVLPTYDKLLLARALLELEAWVRLDATLSTVGDVSPELVLEYRFLLATSYVHTNRCPEALGLLDALAADVAGEPGGRHWPENWPVPRPTRYEIETWRGVALMYAQQLDAARTALQNAAQLDAGRPEAHYYLGLLEWRAGRADLASTNLKNALAHAPKMARAWEALAIIEMEDGRLARALEDLGHATAINFRRASAHFLTAVVQARLGQREPAASALRIAFQLDPNYLAEAKQAEVLTRLFTPEELDHLAAEPILEGLPGTEAARPTSSKP